MQNSKLARSLKKGCNDHIEEIAIIQDKLVTSTVKQKSNKRPNTTLAIDKRKNKRQTAEETTKNGQTEKERKEYFNKMLEKEIAQDTAREAATENRRMKKKLLIKLEHHQYSRRKERVMLEKQQ